MDIYQARLPSDHELLHSLSTIQAARTHLHLLTASNSTPTALVLEIRLCDVLSGEIRAIHCSLAGRVRCRGVIRSSVVAGPIRSRHAAIPQGNSAIVRDTRDI